MAELLPSTVDIAVRWAKNNPAISGVYGTNISSTLPRREDQISYPWLLIQRIIGVTMTPEAPMDRARLQFTSLGGIKSNGLPNWAPADLGIRTVESEVREFVQAQVDDAIIESMSGLEGIMQLQDPDTGEARFWMDAILIVRNA